MSKSSQEKRRVLGAERVITVSKTQFNQQTEEKSFINIRPFGTEPAHVSVKLGRTINLGNYESAKIDVMVDIPCYREEVKDVYQDVLNYVEEVLSKEVSKITEGMQADSTKELI